MSKKKLGLSESKLMGLSADCKELALMLDRIRQKYGVACIDVSVRAIGEPSLNIHEDIESEDVDRALTDVRISEDYIELGSFMYFKDGNVADYNPYQE